MNMPTIAIVLNWRNQTNKSGLYPFHIRIGINDNYRYYKIDTPTKVKLTEWCGQEDGWVKQSHPFAFEISNKIREKKNVVNELIKREYTFNKAISFDSLFAHLKHKGDRHSFYDFMQLYIDNPPEKNKYAERSL